MFSLLHGLAVAVFMALASSQGSAQPDVLRAPGDASSAALEGERSTLALRLAVPEMPAGITQAVTPPEALDAEAEAEEEDPAGYGYALVRPGPEQLPTAFETDKFMGPISYWGSWHLPSGHPRAPPTA